MTWKACGTACPRTCENPSDKQDCTKQCVIGCACNEGFVFNQSGVCIPLRACVPNRTQPATVTETTTKTPLSRTRPPRRGETT